MPAKGHPKPRRTEQELRDQAALLKSLIESPTDIMIFALDRNYCYTAFNASHRQAMRKLYGADVRVGASLLDFIGDQADRSRLQQTICRALAGESFTSVEFDPDLDTWYEFNWSPIHATDGTVEGATAFVLDVTRRKRVETALTESEVKYRNLFESSNDAMMLLNNDRFFDCNPATLRIFGYSTREEFLGKHPADVSPPRQADGRDSHVAADEEMATAFDVGRNYFEWLHQRADGSVFAADVLLTPVAFRGQRILQATVRDISDRKQAEAALHESEERYRRIVGSDAVGIVTVDPSFQFTSANRRFCEMLGYTEEELKRMTFPDMTHPDSVEQDRAAVAELLAGKKPYYRTEKRYFRRDGKEVHAETTVFPVGGESVHPRHTLAIVEDITARKRAEEIDRQHLEDTALLRDTAVGFIQLATDADIYGYIADRLSALVGEAYVIINSYDEAADQFTVRALAGVGARLETVLKVVGRNSVGTAFALARERRSEYASEKLLRFEDGLHGLSYGKLPRLLTQTIEKTFDVGGVYAMGFYWHGRILGTLNLIMRGGAEIRDPGAVEAFVNQAAMALQHRRDADELARHRAHLEELVRARTAELEAANRELEAFSYSVSHDLRAPLRAIDGFAEALIEDAGPNLDARARGHLDRVSAAAQRMAELIDDLLNLAHVSRLPLERKPVNLSEMARTFAAELKSTAPDRSVEFVIPDGLTAPADPVLAAMVLRNLLSNAWKFTARRPAARIEFGETHVDGERVLFVRDDGVGFDMTYADKLFQPFQRLHSEHDFPGSGIGLAIVRRLVERHGGRVWMEGDVDKGTICRFTLEPAAREG